MAKEPVRVLVTGAAVQCRKGEMGPKQCHVCTEAQSKYKCPTCLVPYCSLLCFKKHKEAACEKPVLPEQEPNTSTSVQDVGVERPLNVEKEKEILQKLQLESIASSDEIRNALKDKGLQELIRHVDRAPDPEKELDKAMEDDAFRRFTDKILSSIDDNRQ